MRPVRTASARAEAIQALESAGLAVADAMARSRRELRSRTARTMCRSFQKRVLSRRLVSSSSLSDGERHQRIARSTIDALGNPRLDKGRARGRIDALSAAVIAAGLAEIHESKAAAHLAVCGGGVSLHHLRLNRMRRWEAAPPGGIRARWISVAGRAAGLVDWSAITFVPIHHGGAPYALSQSVKVAVPFECHIAKTRRENETWHDPEREAWRAFVREGMST